MLECQISDGLLKHLKKAQKGLKDDFFAKKWSSIGSLVREKFVLRSKTYFESHEAQTLSLTLILPTNIHSNYV